MKYSYIKKVQIVRSQRAAGWPESGFPAAFLCVYFQKAIFKHTLIRLAFSQVYGIMFIYFSIINIFLITYLLIDRKNNQEYRKKNWYSYVLCIGSIFLVRVMENGVSIHIVYNYITIVIIVMFIGHFLFQRNMKYCILIGSIFLSISLLGQLLSSIFLYPYSGNRVLAELPGIYQVVMMVIAESVIIAGCLTLKKIIERIPPHLSSINVMTIFIPLLLICATAYFL